jgi:hypothetical protein
MIREIELVAGTLVGAKYYKKIRDSFVCTCLTNPLERTAHLARVFGPSPVSPSVGRCSPWAFGIK